MDEEQTINFGNSQPVTIKEKNVRNIEIGTEGTKALKSLSLDTHNHSQDIGDIFTRKIDKFNIHPEARPKAWIEKHTILQQLGLPVVNTLFYDEKNEELVMSDATEGGKKIIIDKEHPPTHQNVQLKNLNQLKEQLLNISRTAYDNGNGVLLSPESYAVTVDTESGEQSVILLDLGIGTWKLSNSKNMLKIPYTEQTATEYAEMFIDKVLLENYD